MAIRKSIKRICTINFLILCTLLPVAWNSNGVAKQLEESKPPLLPHGEKSQILVDRIVAQVEGEPILLSEVESTARIQAANLPPGSLKNAEVFIGLMDEALDFLVEQKMLLAQALRDSIEVHDEEIEGMMEQRFNNMSMKFGTQAKAEEALGYTYREMRKLYFGEIKNQMLTERLQSQQFEKIEVTRKEVVEFYQAHQDSIPPSPQRYRIRHILRLIKPGEEADRVALEAMEQIKEMLDAGTSFEELAADFSEDPGSAVQGGDLGFVMRGELVREFEEVAFLLEPGEISGFVRTEYGYHLIKMIERQGERVHVSHILRTVIGTEADEARIIESINELRERILAGESFEEIAKVYSEDPENKVDGGSLGWVTLENIQLPEFVEPIKKYGLGVPSEPFKTKYGIHILYVDEIEESHAITLESDFDSVEQITLRFKRAGEFEKWLAGMQDRFYVEYKPQLEEVSKNEN